MRESQGVIRAEYIGSSYKKTSEGDVMTEASFKIKAMAGLNHHQIINKNNFKVLYPGGKWQGVVYQASGAPKFKKGKDIILLLSKGPNGFMPTNLALGKYEIHRESGREVVNSDVFPNNEKLSQIPYLKFNGLIEKHFGSELKEVNLDKFVYKGPNNKKYSSNNKKSKSQLSRKPASLDEEKEESGTTSGMIGLVILLAFLGFYSAYLSKGNSNSK